MVKWQRRETELVDVGNCPWCGTPLVVLSWHPWSYDWAFCPRNGCTYERTIHTEKYQKKYGKVIKLD